MTLYGGVEAGGSKFVCEVSSSPTSKPKDTLRVETTTPDETLGKVEAFMNKHRPDAIGVASFGPIDLHRDSRTFGYITGTPKRGWSSTDFARRLERTVGVPVSFETDVNAAVLAESTYGAAKGLSDVVYVTVGTGIGGGALVDGELLHGLVHPEMGHLPVGRYPGDTYRGRCPFHADCLEGMASGPAMEDRWGLEVSKLPRGQECWKMEAWYLAQGVAAMIYTLSPQRIVMGGGVMRRRQLFALVREEVLDTLRGYIRSEEITRRIEGYIVPPGLGDRSGVVGALELARRSVRQD